MDADQKEERIEPSCRVLSAKIRVIRGLLMLANIEIVPRYNSYFDFRISSFIRISIFELRISQPQAFSFSNCRFDASMAFIFSSVTLGYCRPSDWMVSTKIFATSARLTHL